MVKRAITKTVTVENPDISSDSFKRPPGKEVGDLDDWLWIERRARSGYGQRIRVQISEYKGQWGINLRLWYHPKDGGPDEWRPTWKGIWITPDEARAIAKALLAGLEEADRKEAAGLPPF